MYINSSRLYTIVDSSADTSGPIFEAVNDRIASRHYLLAMRTVPKMFRAEYSLCYLGMCYDYRSGTIYPDGDKHIIDIGIDYDLSQLDSALDAEKVEKLSPGGGADA